MRALQQSVRIFLILAISSCFVATAFAQNSKEEKKAQQEAAIIQLIDSQNFVFKAQTALPMGAPSKQLTSDYDLRITKDAVVSYLPYFGRAYSATPGSTDNGLNFTSKDFEYKRTPTKKGDGWEIVIKPKDVKQAREMMLTAYKNGSANLLVTSNDKQNISFTGYITHMPAKKKKS